MGIQPIRHGVLEDFHPVADALFEAICHTFPSVCHSRLSLVEVKEGPVTAGKTDFTTLANVTDGHGSVLCSIGVDQKTYLKLIRHVFPREVATEINQDTRDLLISLMRRSLELAAKWLNDGTLDPTNVGQILVEGSQHQIFSPSVVKTKTLVCESESGPIHLSFAWFPPRGLENA